MVSLTVVCSFVVDHWLPISIALSFVPVLVRALFQPDPGTVFDRRLSRIEALVVDYRKILKSYGIALPGGRVDELGAAGSTGAASGAPGGTGDTIPAPPLGMPSEPETIPIFLEPGPLPPPPLPSDQGTFRAIQFPSNTNGGIS